jgi:Holliday junction resolvase RusA-like endonuclease
MRTPLAFFIEGNPAGQPRARVSTRGGFARAYTPKTIKSAKTGITKEHPATTWRNQVIAEARKWSPVPLWEGAICVNLAFYFQRPKSHFRSNGELKPNAPLWHTSKPDKDNLEKLILDALTVKDGDVKGDFWADDNQVCDGRVRKYYVKHGEYGCPGCYIEVKEASHE